MDIIEIKNPAALAMPDVLRIIQAALEQDPALCDGEFTQCLPELYEVINNPLAFLIIGADPGQPWQAVALGHMPHKSRHLMAWPTCTLIYNEGSKELREAIKVHVLDTFIAAGYTRFLAVNGSGRSDKAWEKTFEHERVKLKRQGTMCWFEVKENVVRNVQSGTEQHSGGHDAEGVPEHAEPAHAGHDEPDGVREDSGT